MVLRWSILLSSNAFEYTWFVYIIIITIWYCDNGIHVQSNVDNTYLSKNLVHVWRRKEDAVKINLELIVLINITCLWNWKTIYLWILNFFNFQKTNFDIRIWQRWIRTTNSHLDEISTKLMLLLFTFIVVVVFTFLMIVVVVYYYCHSFLSLVLALWWWWFLFSFFLSLKVR